MVGLRLFLPESWDDTLQGEDVLLADAIARRRDRAGIPDTERHREKWRLARDMLDQARGDWELPDLPVVADAGYGDATVNYTVPNHLNFDLNHFNFIPLVRLQDTVWLDMELEIEHASTIEIEFAELLWQPSPFRWRAIAFGRLSAAR